MKNSWVGGCNSKPTQKWWQNEKNLATGQSCIRKRSTTCKIGTLVQFSKFNDFFWLLTLLSLLRILFLGRIGSTKLVLPKWQKLGILNRNRRVHTVDSLAKNISKFVSLPWNLHNRHCHNFRDEPKKDPIVMRNDSKRAQEFAKEIEASIEGLGNIELPSRYEAKLS